jgi:ribosomal protein S15P/S13E
MVKAGKIESEEAYFNSLLESKKIMEDDVKENEEKKARLEEELAILQAKAQELQSHIVINPQ